MAFWRPEAHIPGLQARTCLICDGEGYLDEGGPLMAWGRTQIDGAR